jgi:hypothetical protein
MSKQKGLKRDPLDWIGKETEDQPRELPAVPPARGMVGRPATIKREYEKSSQEGLPENWTRATFILREDLLAELKSYAYNKKSSLKEIINEAIELYLGAVNKGAKN